MSINVDERSDIIELAVLMFNAAPGATYLTELTSIFENSGRSLQTLANILAGTPAYIALNPNFQLATEFASAFLTPIGLQNDAFATDWVVSRFNLGESKGQIAFEAFEALTTLGSGAGAQYVAAADILQNKETVAEYYSVTKMVAETDLADLQAVLAGVTADDTTIDTAKAAIDNIAVVGPSFALTTSVDNIAITALNTVNTVSGLVDGTTAANNTFTVGDMIDGNGHTILSLAVTDGGTAAFATVKDVATVELVAGASVTIDFNAVGWSNVGTISLNSGADNLVADFKSLAATTGLSVGTGVAGQLTGEFTNHTTATLFSDRGAAIALSGGDVTGTAGSKENVSFTMTADTAAAAAAITLGTVTLTGAGGAAGVFVTNSQDKGGNITVGDVSVTGFKAADVDLLASHSADSAATNMTVGNVTISAAAAGSATFSATQVATGLTTKTLDLGNMAVGNVAMTLAQGANGMIEIGNEAQNTGAGAATVGTLTVGTINAVLDTDANATIDLWNIGSGITGAGTAGNVAIGDVTLTQGINSNVDLSIAVTGTGAANAGGVGTVTLGNITDIGDDGAVLAFSVDVTSAKNIGNIALGNVTLTGGVSSDMTVDISATALKSVGTVTLGNVALTGGVNSTVSMSVSLSADTAMGALTIGSVAVDAAASATVEFGFFASAATAMGNLTVGNVAVNASGVSALGTVDITVENDGTGSIGNITFGSIAVNAGKSATGEFYFSASSADTVGNLTVGNVTVSAVGASAFASYSSELRANVTIGNTVIGDVSVTANGKGATAEFTHTAESAILLGTTTVGNVNLTSHGESASAAFSIDLTSSGSTGLLTVGNVNVDVDPGAAKTGAAATVDLTSTGAIKLGDVSVHGAARGTTDTTMTYTANVTASAGTTLTVGNITVSGGDGTSDNLADLAGWLHLTAGTTTTIGNVDYSGYGAKATIDVHGFSGAAAIIGTAKADTITDNKGVNDITGGAGGDTFTFQIANTGKALGAMDQITDFSESAGDKILFSNSLAVDSTNYSEASFADFASFVTGADAANKAVFVGSVTGTGLIVAVDADANGSVDFMIQLVGVTSLGSIDVAAFQ